MYVRVESGEAVGTSNHVDNDDEELDLFGEDFDPFELLQRLEQQHEEGPGVAGDSTSLYDLVRQRKRLVSRNRRKKGEVEANEEPLTEGVEQLGLQQEEEEEEDGSSGLEGEAAVVRGRGRGRGRGGGRGRGRGRGRGAGRAAGRGRGRGRGRGQRSKVWNHSGQGWFDASVACSYDLNLWPQNVSEAP